MIAVIGGGLCGLSCAIRLAQAGYEVQLFEAAPQLGGRTRSFFEPAVGQWVDNGPHLLVGAYQATRKLLREANAEAAIDWQPGLDLPLWDHQRGLFQLKPSTSLPFPLAMAWALFRLPGHGLDSVRAMFRLARHAPRAHYPEPVVQWLQQLHIPRSLVHDLLEPLCLGAMNESIHTADASSFHRVLFETFCNHEHARLGWFRGPMLQTLIRPLEKLAYALGVRIETRCRIVGLEENRMGVRMKLRHGWSKKSFSAAVLTVPPHAKSRLLSQPVTSKSNPITNVHLWFDRLPGLPAPFVGGLDTLGHWFFDLNQSPAGEKNDLHHLCVVVSGQRLKPDKQILRTLCREIADICRIPQPERPRHARIVCEQRATTLVAPQQKMDQNLSRLIDASEQPSPGELPATIESAIRRGEKSAEKVNQIIN